MDASIPNSGIKKISIPGLVNSLCYELITAAEVLLQLRLLNPFKASGPEKIPNSIYISW